MKGLDGRFTAASWTVHLHLDLTDTKLLSVFCTDFGGTLGGEGGAFSTPLEADRSGRSPSQHVAVPIGHGNDGVVEAALNVDDPLRDVSSRPFLLRVSHVSRQLISKGTVRTLSNRCLACSATFVAPGNHGRLPQILDALLAGDGLLWSLAGPGVGPGSLASHRQILAVTRPPERADVLEPLDVLLNGSAKLTLDDVVVIEQVRDPSEFIVAQLAGRHVGTDFCPVADLAGKSRPHAIQVAERNISSLIRGDVNTQQSRHGLTLALLMSRIAANHDQLALSADNLAVFADATNATSDFHGILAEGRVGPASRTHTRQIHWLTDFHSIGNENTPTECRQPPSSGRQPGSESGIGRPRTT